MTSRGRKVLEILRRQSENIAGVSEPGPSTPRFPSTNSVPELECSESEAEPFSSDHSEYCP
ncbi:unnamed protein product, partial [Callosobruchus maculatus]